MQQRILLFLVVVVAASTAQQVSPCSQQEGSPDTRACRSPQLQWYYSADQGKCLPFIWSGCGGNDNRFDSLLECSKTCCPPNGCDNPCEQPMWPGPCDGDVPRYYYSANQSECLQFQWGGCYPDANNFKTLADCQQNCL